MSKLSDNLHLSPERLAAEIFPIKAGLILTDRGRTLDFHGRRPTAEEIWTLLESVPDPEVPVVSVVDLGIVRSVENHNGIWVVQITPTYSGCPATELIKNEIILALERAGVDPLEVRQQMAPAWTTEWISDDGRRKLREFGIAPPTGKAGESDNIECPRCGSVNHKRISEFGSTACKALYQCHDCQEPFDYFKCI